jgi:pyridoxamine 5'-phosphate oxidase
MPRHDKFRAVDLIPDSFLDPIELFAHYYERARQAEPHDATAVALGTADSDGRPAVRMVLLKGTEDGHFHFFTSYLSRKARHLEENPHGALCFYWPLSGVQVRAEGDVGKLDAAASDAYFATRPRGSQLAAWASKQSAALDSRDILLNRYRDLEARYDGRDVPRPTFWGGYRLIPRRVEFWHSGPYRMHDRLLYQRDDDGNWRKMRLFP